MVIQLYINIFVGCCSDAFFVCLFFLLFCFFFLQVVDEVVNSVSHCLVMLKCPTKKKKKQHRVAFMELLSSEPLDSSEADQCLPYSDSRVTLVNVERLYNGCLLDLVCNICTLCMNEITKNNSVVHLKLLSSLIPDFTSTKLVKSLLDSSNGPPTTLFTSENDDYSILCEEFLLHTLFPWIKSSLPGNENVTCVFKDSRSVDYLINILCGIITALPIVKQVELVSESLQVSCLYNRCCARVMVKLCPNKLNTT